MVKNMGTYEDIIKKIQDQYNELLTFLGLHILKNEYPVYLVNYDGLSTYVLYRAEKEPIFMKKDFYTYKKNIFKMTLDDDDWDEIILLVTYFDTSSIFNKLITELFAKEIKKIYDSKINAFSRFSHILDDAVDKMAETYNIAKINSNADNKFINFFPNVDLIINISKSKYENRVCFGEILFVDENVKLEIEFVCAFKFNFVNLKQIRKMLELTDNKLAIIVKNDSVIGLGYSSVYSFKLIIKGYSKWELYDSNSVILLYNDTFLRLNNESNNFTKKIQYFFHLDLTDAETINRIIAKYANCKHGTVLIITREAEYEAARLSNLNRAILIRPINLGRNYVTLSDIDGALIMDCYGNCFAIGAILDGETQIVGNMSRGARYNSSINYIANKNNKKYMAAIISEDGDINVVDTLDIQNNDMYQKIK